MFAIIVVLGGGRWGLEGSKGSERWEGVGGGQSGWLCGAHFRLRLKWRLRLTLRPRLGPEL